MESEERRGGGGTRRRERGKRGGSCTPFRPDRCSPTPIASPSLRPRIYKPHVPTTVSTLFPVTPTLSQQQQCRRFTRTSLPPCRRRTSSYVPSSNLAPLVAHSIYGGQDISRHHSPSSFTTRHIADPQFGPSPVQYLPKMTEALGGKVKIYAKREDCNSGLAYGGNKVRKASLPSP